MSERILAYDQVEIDSSKMEHYDHDVFGPVTVFKDVVIAREIVHEYKDGFAYKPADELEAAFWTATDRWAIAGGHPDSAVIMDRDQIHGRTTNVRFTNSLIDPKTKRPNNRGIIADLEVFDNKVAPETLESMKNGTKTDVSIGFFFSMDKTPGKIEDEKHPLNGISFDYVQRNLSIDHTAFALEKGRCPMPFCGIGADEITMRITGDPFAGYKNFAECVKKNQDKEDPKAYCGAIKAKVEAKKDVFKTALENMKSEIEAVLVQFEDSEEQLNEDEDKNIGDSMSLAEVKDWFRLSDESWNDLEETERLYLKSLYREKNPVVIQDTVDECPECEDDEEEIQRLATDLSLEEIDSKLSELKTAREGYREQIRKLDEELYDEPDSEKKRKTALRKEIGELWDKIDDLYDEIRAYTQAKTLKITQSALADEGEEIEEDSEQEEEKEPQKPTMDELTSAKEVIRATKILREVA